MADREHAKRKRLILYDLHRAKFPFRIERELRQLLEPARAVDKRRASWKGTATPA